MGFLCSKDFITYTTIGLRGRVWVLFVAVGFIYLYVHDHGARRRRSGFLLFEDFLTYTTTGPRLGGDGVGFLLHDGPKLLRREEVGGGSFVC